MSKIKNIIIFVSIAVALVLIYIFFIKPSDDTPAALISSGGTPTTSSGVVAADANSKVARDFLDSLLNIKNIKLNDTIFSDNAFISLHDSSITLTPDGTEGRVNPFAALGNDAVSTPSIPTVPPACTLPKVLDTTTNTCVNPSH
ncbi:MAG: hypothetical protein NTZ87_01835 [Candidatus Nomurabacteria bacterium]|nr:hypothetical protein [Candidatus Nomurabacteria bacterium]